MPKEKLETITDLFGEKALTVFIATIGWMVFLCAATFLHVLLNHLEDKGRDAKNYCSCKDMHTRENKRCSECKKRGHPEHVGANSTIPVLLSLIGLVAGPTAWPGTCWCFFFYTSIRMWCYTLYPAVKRNLRTYRLEDETRERQINLLKLLKQNSRAYFESPEETYHYNPSITAWHQSQWGWADVSILICILLPKTSILVLAWIWFDIMISENIFAMQIARVDLWPLWEKAKACAYKAVASPPKQEQRGLTSVLELQSKLNKLEELLKDPKYTEAQKGSLRETESVLRAEIVAAIASISSDKVAIQ